MPAREGLPRRKLSETRSEKAGTRGDLAPGRQGHQGRHQAGRHQAPGRQAPGRHQAGTRQAPGRQAPGQAPAGRPGETGFSEHSYTNGQQAA